MNGWSSKKLKEVGISLIDCVHKTPSEQADGYPYVGIPQMKLGRITFDGARKISEADFLEWTKKAKPQKHDVVLSRRTNPGVTATFGDDVNFALGQNLVLLRSDGSEVLPELLRWLVLTPEWWAQIKKFNNVGAVFDSLRCGDVPNFELSIPPKAAQVGIAEVLGALDGQIEANRRLNETLEGIARRLFQSWFVDFDPVLAKAEGRPTGLAPDLDELFPAAMGAASEVIPEGWLASGFDRYAKPAGEPVSAQALSDETPYIALEHMPRRSIVLSDWEGAGGLGSNKARFREGDTLFGKLRPYFHKVGLALVDGVCSTDIVVLRPTAPRFRAMTLFAASSDAFVSFVDVASTGTKMPRTNWARMKQFQVVDPGREVAEAFEQIASPMLARIKLNTEQSRTLAALRDLLLPRLMSGAIRVRDAEAMLEQVA